MTKGKWPIAALEELITEAPSGFASGERASDGVIQLRMNNVTIDGHLDWSSIIRVPATKQQIEKYQLCSCDVLFNSTNSPDLVGKTTIFVDIGEPVVFSNHFFRLRVNSAKLDPSYLKYWCVSQWQSRIFEHLSTQWVNQAAVRIEDLLLLQIYLPPLPEQKRIATILGKADRLRCLRRYARELSDTYLQSVFLEMFGDPVINPKGWERAKVSDLGKVQTGNTPSRDNPLNYGNDIEWLKSDNIIEGVMLVSNSREMLSKQGAKIGRMVKAGSVVVTCIAGSPTTIGNVALTDRLVAFNQQINSVTPYKDVDPHFLYGMLKVAKPLVQRSTTLGMKRIITKSKFENLVLIKPPQLQQKRFARIILKYERLQSQQREAERQAEHLFQTLLHKAFNGELS